MSRNASLTISRLAIALGPVLLAATVLAPRRVAAQAATVLYGCYVPNSGTVYRIKGPGLPNDCRSDTHVQFTWSLQGPQGPQGPQGAQGPQGVQGPAGTPGGVSGRVVVTAEASIGAGQPGFALAKCPTGKKLVGGGGFADTGTQFYWNGPDGTGGATYTPSDTDWKVGIVNPFAALARSVTAIAICADVQ